MEDWDKTHSFAAILCIATILYFLAQIARVA